MHSILFSWSKSVRWMLLTTAIVVITGFIMAQQPAPAPQTSAPPSNPASGAPLTLKVTTRMVTLQISARDAKGHPIPGLTADDFQIFEQIPPKKDQHPQHIAVFQQVNVQAIAASDKGGVQLPAGVYSNLVTMQKVPVPPTILLMDGLNTTLAGQMQVHRQMVKLLSSIPLDIPVAVFLLDRNLHLLQNFSTDRSLLRTAVDHALSVGSPELNPTDVRSDADALATLVQDNPPPPPPAPAGASGVVGAELQQVHDAAMTAQVQQLQNFERETSAALITTRVQITVDAFRSIARHVQGYPGRKNLLWVSSSFPLAIFPDSDFKFAGMAEFSDKFAMLANVLSDAKIAVYPMDPAGLESDTFYDAGSRQSARVSSVGRATSSTVMREETTRASNQESMTQLADQTGGRVCVNNNDLGDCVKKAIEDGSTYYEVAYYPEVADWNGEFHRIIVKTHKSNVRLAFREGYYARGGAIPDKDDKKQPELQQAGCQDLLTATNILVMAQSIPAGDPSQVKFFLAVDPQMISFVPEAAGRKLSVMVAACSYDQDGRPLQFLQQPTDVNLSEQDYKTIMAQHGFPRTIAFAPPAGAVRVRLLVRDNPTGKMGSVDVPLHSGPVAASAPAAPTSNANSPAPR